MIVDKFWPQGEERDGSFFLCGEIMGGKTDRQTDRQTDVQTRMDERKKESSLERKFDLRKVKLVAVCRLQLARIAEPWI